VEPDRKAVDVMNAPTLANEIALGLDRVAALRKERDKAQRALAALEADIAVLEADLELTGRFYVEQQAIPVGDRERVKADLEKGGVVL
jgi:hypothetical protein